MTKTDFEVIKEILKRSGRKFKIEKDFTDIIAPSEHPENYTAGVCFSFNEDGSLYSVHSYEPDGDEEEIDFDFCD